MAQILVFGDSIIYGAWDKNGGWVSRLRKFLDEKTITDSNFYCLIYNLGVSGDTTEDLLERFEFETKQRLKEDEETIFIFGIGINDSQFIHSQNSLRYSIGQFRANIQKLINLAQKFSSKIIFVGLTPIDETKTMPIPKNIDKTYKNEYIKQNNKIIKSICRENNLLFIDIFDKLMKLGYKKLLEDGLHPNSAGHQNIFKIVKEFLIENKII